MFSVILDFFESYDSYDETKSDLEFGARCTGPLCCLREVGSTAAASATARRELIDT